MSPASEARPPIEALFAGLVFAALLLDENGLVREANHAAETMLGRSAARMIGSDIFEFMQLDNDRVRDAMADPTQPLVARDIGLRGSGQPVDVNLTVSPIAGYAGWRVLTLSDAGQARMSGNSDSQALRAPAVLSHEIKNPLAAIKGAAQLVERKLVPADQPLAQLITNEVDRIASLVDRMQHLGRETAQPLAPCNLHEAIRRAVATVRAAQRPADEGVEFAEEFDPSLPSVVANRELLEQVLINLLSNARDACCDQSDAKVTVRTRFTGGIGLSQTRGGTAVKLPIEAAVIDNGPGVAAELRDHIFEPFVTSKKNGQGLGLPLVRKLVRDMDGRISHLRDDRAGRTEFRINLQSD
ncbi:Histidine kinase [Alteripontixanthobacter maritimus]|uniref:histidine kinase n=2 Tax=Alteripontixanthobacter maritimus TaxID=2161824 RepID=A0A369Q9V2_9SPHN|nr:Histidine kinase [Alteripontixanthobacter maritimus]